MKSYTLGVDVGTTTVKAVLVDETGCTAYSAKSEYETNFPHPGWVEQDPEEWWKGTCNATRQVLQMAGCGGECVRAVAVSAQAPTMIAVNTEGKAVHPAMIWMDRRCEDICQMLRKEFGEEKMLRITGNGIDPFYVLPKILWFKTHRPDLFERTHLFLQVNGYINYRLTGNFTMDRVHATLVGAYDYQKQKWSREILNAECVQLSEDIFPPIYDNDAVIGAITANAAQQTGLKTGTVVVAGSVDGAAAAVEAGVVRTGDAVEMTGTSSVLLLSMDKPLPTSALTYMRHQISGLHLTLGCMSTTGAAFRWFQRELASKNSDAMSYERMNRQIMIDAPNPTGLIFLPYMNGERAPIWDTNARGTWIGMTLGTQSGQMMRSIMEGSSFATRSNLECARRAGICVHNMRCTGGHTASDIWMRIKASVLGIPIEIVEAGEGAPWGAALLGGVAIGMYPSEQYMIEHSVVIKRTVEPNPEWVKHYDEQYEIYVDAYRRLRELYPNLHKLQFDC